MKKFDLLVSEITNESLARIFGRLTSECIFVAAERHMSLTREEVGQNFLVFQSYLEKLLGQEQANIIQSVIMQRLCLRLRLEYEEVASYFTFLEKLYETNFNLLMSSCMENRPACN